MRITFRVQFVASLLLATWVAAAQPDSHPAIYTNQALAPPPASVGHSPQQPRWSLIRTVRLLRKQRSSLQGSPTRAGRYVVISPGGGSGAIADGFTFGEIATWLQALFSPDSQEFFTAPGELSVVRDALQRAYDQVLRFHPGFHEAVPASDLAANLAPEGGWAWFDATVDNPFRFLLGYQVALAADLVRFLDQLGRAGEVRDGQRRVVASLSDESGRPYPHLVAEYVLHEYLERSGIGHDGAIKLTTQLFGYDTPSRPGDLDRGQKFSRPGETPLGRALRQFVSWRFEEYLASVIGRDLHLTVLAITGIGIPSLVGRAARMVRARDQPARLKIEDGHSAVLVDVARIVRVRPGYAAARKTFESEDVSSEAVQARLDKDEMVTLSEPQIRRLSVVSGPRATWINKVLAEIRFARDMQALAMRPGMRTAAELDSFFYEWALDLADSLAPHRVMLFLDMRLQINTPTPPGSVQEFPMSIVPSVGRENVYRLSLAQTIKHVLRTYGEITIIPLHNYLGQRATEEAIQIGATRTGRASARFLRQAS